MNLEDDERRYFLRTKRLGFRSWGEDDLPIAIRLWGDPRVARFIDSRGQLSSEEVGRLLRKHIDFEREYQVQYWPVFRLEDNDHVGCCGLRPYDLGQRLYEIGVHLRPQFWRQGFAQEAMSAVIQHAFEELDLSSLFAGHNPNNKDSERLLRRLGFRFTRFELYPATGLEHPSYVLERPSGTRGLHIPHR
jgi:[ribosomal protein S5]-alanine N-acetyltransferase